MAEKNKWEKIKYEDLILKDKLGKGAFGEVYLSEVKGIEGVYATKKLEKSNYKKNTKAYKYLKNEIDILKDTDHENIIKLYNSNIETNKFIFLITEYCNGGDLNSCLEYYQKEKGRPFSEEEVQHIMRQILSALYHLHIEKKILHRDLKPENILLHYDNEEDRLNKRIMKAKIKLIDFGFARYLKNELAESVLGSPFYMDPRILFKLNKINNNRDFGYDQKADIYSLGVISYTLTTGNSFIDVTTMRKLVDGIKNFRYEISSNLSKECVSFLNYMLRYDSKKRLNVDKLLTHKFITKNINELTKIDKKKLGGNMIGSHIFFDINSSSIIYIDNDVFEKKENEKDKVIQQENEKPDEIQQKFIEQINNIKINPDKKPVKPKKNQSLKELFLESFEIINNDAMRINQHLIPFFPGDDENINIKIMK